MKQTRLTVPDISCDHCKASIEGAVGRLEGVDVVDVEVESKTVALTYDEAVDLDTIIGTIEEQGYDVPR